MDTTGLKFPKMPRKKKRSRVTKDGRLIESPSQYRATKLEMFNDQQGMCERCFRPMNSLSDAHRHHPGGRGMGGSKRDDSKTVLWCENCHVQEHERLRHEA